MNPFYQPAMPTRPMRALCDHEQLPNGIHQIVLRANSQNTVNEWLDCLEMIYRQPAPSSTIYTTIYTLTKVEQPDLPPMSCLAHLCWFWMSHSDDHLRSRNAILHQSGSLSPAAEAVTATLLREQGHRLRFFPANAQDAAMRWLLAGD